MNNTCEKRFLLVKMEENTFKQLIDQGILQVDNLGVVQCSIRHHNSNYNKGNRSCGPHVRCFVCGRNHFAYRCNYRFKPAETFDRNKGSKGGIGMFNCKPNVTCYVCGNNHLASKCDRRFKPVTSNRSEDSENKQSGSREHDEEYENMMRSK